MQDFMQSYWVIGAAGTVAAAGAAAPPFKQLLTAALYSAPFLPLLALAQSPIFCCCGVSGLAGLAAAALLFVMLDLLLMITFSAGAAVAGAVVVGLAAGAAVVAELAVLNASIAATDRAIMLDFMVTPR